MASVYTECVKTGEVTDLRDFIARSFIRGDEEPSRIGLVDGKWRYRKHLYDTSYWEERMAKEKETLAWLEKADGTQLAELAKQAWDQVCQRVKDSTEHDQKKIAIRARYEAMLTKLRDWQKNLPHEGLLSFSRGLIAQLEQALLFDCGKKEANPEQPVLATPAEYKAAEIGTCQHMIKLYEGRINNEKREVEERNAILNSLCCYLNGGEEGDYSLPLS